ncbi:hypothetical protein BDA96_01G482500 [Sorghum bicolor]|uniref:Uncharacterized protein n=2 Tax=Sorghum bicolor TaxID=4558 RepID=A0A921V133_SORBI|nr:hypothetical protein BDA96_01G482500 [Sorghum bicolor]KXG39848.1 hypothetical protein SORBI_3001G452800 [Sorghum bicolor]
MIYNCKRSKLLDLRENARIYRKKDAACPEVQWYDLASLRKPKPRSAQRRHGLRIFQNEKSARAKNISKETNRRNERRFQAMWANMRQENETRYSNIEFWRGKNSKNQENLLGTDTKQKTAARRTNRAMPLQHYIGPWLGRAHGG